MVRPNQLLSLSTSGVNNAPDDQGLGSTPRKGRIGGLVKDFTEQDSAYGELALTQPLKKYSSQKITKNQTPLLNEQIESNENGEIGEISTNSEIRDLDWQSRTAVPLLKNLKRITAPNPSMMTGPGTNTYIVGTDLTGYIVIDPGPYDIEHTAQIFKACCGDIQMIVCTHSHPDHSPGARPLQLLCEKNSDHKPPILGLASRPTAKPSGQFQPDRELRDKECLVLKSKTIELSKDLNSTSKPEIHTLEVIYTPGHAANHVCLILQEDGLLFSGDHVLNGSTTVVDPPDGNMGQYLSSLTLLAKLCEEKHIEFIFPAHGYVLGNYFGKPRSALSVIEGLYAHRMKRELKILKVIQNNPKGSMDDWVKIAYDDVPSNVWPVAKRSLLAHFENLKANNLV